MVTLDVWAAAVPLHTAANVVGMDTSPELRRCSFREPKERAGELRDHYKATFERAGFTVVENVPFSQRGFGLLLEAGEIKGQIACVIWNRDCVLQIDMTNATTLPRVELEGATAVVGSLTLPIPEGTVADSAHEHGDLARATLRIPTIDLELVARFFGDHPALRPSLRRATIGHDAAFLLFPDERGLSDS